MEKLEETVLSDSTKKLTPTDLSPYISIGLFNWISAQEVWTTGSSFVVPETPILSLPNNLIIPLLIELLFNGAFVADV